MNLSSLLSTCDAGAPASAAALRAYVAARARAEAAAAASAAAAEAARAGEVEAWAARVGGPLSHLLRDAEAHAATPIAPPRVHDEVRPKCALRSRALWAHLGGNG